MIEIIQEENWDSTQERKGLPKNIKQIGTPDMGDRIYIENTAYQKMHPYGRYPEKMVYVMLGRFDDFAGHTCIFIEDAIRMNEVEFAGKLPGWNDESWGYLYRKLKPEHENMIIVGWAVDICGQLPSMTAQLERVHQTYFGGVHQILFLMDTLEREEIFFSNRNGYLKRREGFYVYYDKTIPGRMESAMETIKTERESSEKTASFKEDEASRRQESYRNYLNHRKTGHRRIKQPVYRSSYSSTVLLLLVIAALGYSAFQNHQKMENMEQALTQMNELQAVMQTEVEKENAVKVEDVVGNVTPTQTQEVENVSTEQQNAASTQIPVTELPSAQTETNTEAVPETSVQAVSEAEAYLAQGYYIVQSGDSLANICRKIYHTTAILEQLCELNGIDNPDAIYAGQRLVLPN